LYVTPVECRAIHDALHEIVEDEDAKENEGNQRKRLQQEVQHDAMLKD